MSVSEEVGQNNGQSYDLMSKLSFCVFDLETTGGNHDYDKIIEIGLVKIINLEIVDQADYLVNPEINIPEFIQKLTAITNLDVEGCPIIEEVIEDILDFMGDSILVAHNTSFDIPFFNSILERLGKKTLNNKAICTNLMTKHLMPNLLNSNLQYMSNIFNIEHTKAHRALDDAMAAAELLLKYLEIFICKGIPRINHLYYPQNHYRLDCIHYTKKDKTRIILEKICSLKSAGLITLKGAQGKVLFAFPCFQGGQGKKIIEKMLEKYDWDRVSLKLYGSFLEVLVHLGETLKKIKQDIRQEIVKHLSEICLSSGAQEEKKSTFIGDFVMAHHLVPEQMVILPVQNFTYRNQLVFRYPGHEKKLLHYVKKNRNRKTGQGGDGDSFWRDFVYHYLSQARQDKSGNLYMFKRRTALGDYKRFTGSLNRFLKKNPNPHNYPHYYI